MRVVTLEVSFRDLGATRWIPTNAGSTVTSPSAVSIYVHYFRRRRHFVHRRWTEGYRYPYFLDWGYHTPTFSDTSKKMEFAVIRGDLRRLNYSKTVFGQVSAPDPATELMSLLSVQGATFLPPELVSFISSF